LTKTWRNPHRFQFYSAGLRNLVFDSKTPFQCEKAGHLIQFAKKVEKLKKLDYDV